MRPGFAERTPPGPAGTPDDSSPYEQNPSSPPLQVGTTAPSGIPLRESRDLVTRERLGDGRHRWRFGLLDGSDKSKSQCGRRSGAANSVSMERRSRYPEDCRTDLPPCRVADWTPPDRGAAIHSRVTGAGTVRLLGKPHAEPEQDAGSTPAASTSVS